MTITTDKIPKDPLCEGWLEKLALRRGFSLLASKGWNRRYCFLTRRGLGYGHTNPREKSHSNPKVPLRPSNAKCFIPFDRHKGRETVLLPVYYIRDVSATKNPEVPSECINGVCTNVVKSTEDAKPRRYYYFALTFEEKRKRYTLFLRTDSPQAYIKWTSFLPLYVHQACASTLVPFAHPLEVNRSPPVDMNRRRLVNKDSEAVSEGHFLRDPDPCTADEYQSIRRRCLQWHEGERQRLIPAAKAYVRDHGADSDVLATKSLEDVQQLTFEQRLAMLNAIADALCTPIGEDVPDSQAEGEEGADISAGSDVDRLAAPNNNNNANNDSNSIVVGSPHAVVSCASASDDQIQAAASVNELHKKHDSRLESGQRHGKHTKAKAAVDGGEHVALFSNKSNEEPAAAGKQQPSRLLSGLLEVTFTAKDDDMKGSNDTNGRTPRVAKPRAQKVSRQHNGKTQQQAAKAGLNNTAGSAGDAHHVI